MLTHFFSRMSLIALVLPFDFEEPLDDWVDSALSFMLIFASSSNWRNEFVNPFFYRYSATARFKSSFYFDVNTMSEFERLLAILISNEQNKINFIFVNPKIHFFFHTFIPILKNKSTISFDLFSVTRTLSLNSVFIIISMNSNWKRGLYLGTGKHSNRSQLSDWLFVCLFWWIATYLGWRFTFLKR